MSARVRLIGIVCGGPMKPTSTESQNGGKSMLRFQMSVADETKPPNEDKSRPTQIYQVNLGSENLFKYITPGRRVLIDGRLTHRPRAVVNGSNELTAYPNPVVQMDHLHFLTPQEDVQLERTLDKLANLGVITEDAAKEHTVKARQAIMARYEEDPPQRHVKNNTSNESPDPDHPDFEK